MNKIFHACYIAVATLGLALPAAAAPWVIDFDNGVDGGGAATTFDSRTIFGDTTGTNFQRYNGGATIIPGGANTTNGGIPGTSFGVTISASGGQGFAVGFDSTGPYNSSIHGNDNDLVENFSTPLDGSDPNGYRNILIVQTDNKSGISDSCNIGGSGVCGTADDEVGSSLEFAFDTAVDLIGMNVFDIGDGSPQGGTVTFFDSLGAQIGGVLTMLEPLDRGVAFMSFGNLAQAITVMKVVLDGSGAIDNITGATPQVPVPEPAAAALFGIGLIGLALLRRRRKATA